MDPLLAHHPWVLLQWVLAPRRSNLRVVSRSAHPCRSRWPVDHLKGRLNNPLCLKDNRHRVAQVQRWAQVLVDPQESRLSIRSRV